MSDLIELSELIDAANDDSTDPPQLPPTDQRQAIRRAGAVPLIVLATMVGVSEPTLRRAEAGARLRDAGAERKYRRVLAAIRQRVVERDPHGLAEVA